MSKLRFFAIFIFAVSFALAASPQIVDNSYVIEMTKGHVPEPIILKMVNTQRTQFDLSPKCMIELTNAGVSENVIKAIVDRTGVASPQTSVPSEPVNRESTIAAKSISTGGAQVASDMTSTSKIPDGTPVPLILIEAISSESAQRNEVVHFEVSEDVVISGVVVIPKGTAAEGIVSLARAKASMAVPGLLSINLTYLKFPSGNIRISGSLEGNQVSSGFGRSALVSMGAVWKKGKSISYPRGTEVRAVVGML